MDAPKLAGFSSRMVRGEWPPVSIAFVKGNGEDGNSGEPSIAGMEWGREMLAELDRIVSEPIDGNGTAIDGKASSRARNAGERVPCLVNAWSAANRLMLGGERVSGKENEIAAIPRVLGWLDIRGALVSAAAIACQKKIAALIRRKGGGYLLALKDNHSVFRDEMQRWIEGVPLRRDGTAVDAFETRERAHGRDEWRKCRLVKRPCGFDSAEGWQDLAWIALVETRRSAGGRTGKLEKRLYICSREMSARDMLAAVRAHWGIESAHWVLDVVFGEDYSRARTGHFLPRRRFLETPVIRRALALCRWGKAINAVLSHG